MNDLSDIARRYQDSLPALPRSVFRIDALDRIGVPVVQANLHLRDEAPTTGHGYGVTAAEAEVGAWGELAEEFFTDRALARMQPRRASFAVLEAEGALDPLTLCLPAGSGYAPDMPLDWVRGRRLGDDAALWVPLEWVAAYPYQMPSPARLIVPITNGLGAGFDIAHAIGHGLMELLQRDGNVLTYRALDRGMVVDIDTAVDAQVAGLIAHLRNIGIEVTVKLASSEFGLTNLYVVGDDRGQPTVPIQITACGEACHPDRDRALRKALFEFVGSRARKAATHGPIPLLRASLPAAYVEPQMAQALAGEESRALDAMADWVALSAPELRRHLADSVFAQHGHVAFSSLPSVPADAVADPAARLQLLTERLADAGLDIVWVDLSPADSDVRVVKVIVPGLESETMSYHRIGWRGVRRLRERHDRLIADSPCTGAQPVRLRPEDEARAGGPAWFDATLADAMVGALYPLYREPNTFSAQLLASRRRGAAAA